MQKLGKLFRKIPVKFRWATFVVLAFSSFLSFVTVGSAFADEHKVNGLFTIYGIVSAILTVGIAIIAAQESAENERLDNEEKGI